MANRSSIAKRWRDLSGGKRWAGLLEPELDIDLRRYIIHYGERAGAVADAFNDDKISKWYRFSRYSPQDLFSNVGLELGNPFKYTVTNFFYARAEIDILFWDIGDESSWMGYVAVATDQGKAVLGRRDILISWRGTRSCLETWEDINFLPTSASTIFGETFSPKVHQGFLSLYTCKSSNSEYNKMSAREQVLREVRKLVDYYQDEEISITVTGHSLGSALATLNAMDIVANGYNKPSNGTNKEACPVTAFVFASPRAGDEGFQKVYSTLDNLHILRITNKNDPVPQLPPCECGFVDVGVELEIDSNKSTFLKGDKKYAHNLELYLHTLAGTQGIVSEAGFKLVVPRSISLVNKSSDALKDELKEPVQWWIEKNKSMIQIDDGSWELDDRGYAPLPTST